MALAVSAGLIEIGTDFVEALGSGCGSGRLTLSGGLWSSVDLVFGYESRFVVGFALAFLGVAQLGCSS